MVFIAVSSAFCHASVNTGQEDYAKSLLAGAGTDAQLRVIKDMGHREAFCIRTDKGKVVVEAATEAGLIYGAQAIAERDYESDLVDKPDFNIRGTTICLMPGGYRATLSPKLYPWFYDKEFMTRTLDSFAAARLNTIFLWAGHMFPYIVEMPDYPEAASDIPPQQVKANQEQFRWFTSECEKRNIKVLLHFYNIHVSPPFAKAHKMRTNPTTPTPLLKKYTHYALSRYFKEFASVGLYACPGESIHSKYQLEWFRDVIFDAAKKSGKNPVIVIRDWTQNMEFRDNIKNLYDNAYTEQKHNDESLTSPCPDVRIMQMEGIAVGHIVNFHLVTDLVPMRWGSPLILQESMQHLKKLGFVKGVEFFGQMFWKWPYTLDKLEPSQKGYFPQGPKLVSLDRDAIYFKAFGRYLWRSDREPMMEQVYWIRYLTKKFGSQKVGRELYLWYILSGPISPGLQNLNATKVAGWWPSVMLHNQSVDQILTYNKRLDETPYTLYRETGRAGQRFYPRPFDAFFFDRYREHYSRPKPGSLPAMYKEFAPYKERLGIDNLEQRHCMPVSQYAKALEEGRATDQAMTPDKTAALLNTLARISLLGAEKIVEYANDSGVTADRIKELERFVTDSKMYVLATQAMLHKEKASIAKARMLLSGSADMADEFLREMEASVKVYEKLADLTQRTYLHGNDLQKSHWKDSGLKEFRSDLAKQRDWLDKFKQQLNAVAAREKSLTIGLTGDSKVASTYGWASDVCKLRYYRQVEPGKPNTIECDVAVYGGTPAGVTAAIQAARMRKKVVFLSFNRHVGGMTSGGLTATDVGNKESIGGLAREFYTRIGRIGNFRPSQAESLFLKMLDEASVSVLFERCLESVDIKDGRVVSITMETGETIKAAVFIDTTYEGDLLAAANVSYRVGREPAGAYNESLAGLWQSVSHKDVYEFCRLPISPFVVPDDPNSGLLPEISSEQPGKAGHGDFKVQAYNFRMYLTDKPGKIPFPKPPGYDPGRYALLGRFLNFDSRIRWTLNYTTRPMTDGPVQMRNGDSNNAGSFSSDYIGGNYRWPDGTYKPVSFEKLPEPSRGMPMPLSKLYEVREQIFQDHVNYQQGLMYFLANNRQVPKKLQERVNRFGLDPNEFKQTGYWPHQLYIREGRRMVSEYVMTQANCQSKRTVSDSVGLASYPMDSHFCQRVVVEENGKKTVRNDGNFGYRCPKPYPISYRSIVPKKEECENLLVPVCLSASHVAYGSIRMEPVFMILGQSAAAAAVLAIDEGVAVQDISYEKLKSRLLKDGQQITRP